MSDGSIHEYYLISLIVLKFKNRQTVYNVLLLTGDDEFLLAAIPLKDIDALIHPLRQKLIVKPNHPYPAQMKV